MISAEKIVITFFIIAVVVSVSGLAGMGITFIVLLESVESYLVVILLVTSFAVSVLRNGLNLKNNRIAYAKAFRVLEFALDEYRLSDKKKEDKEKLCEANREAQKVIEIYNE